MTSAEKAFCDSWCKIHARKWQVLNRAQWKYRFRGKAMVRFVEEVQMRENEVRLLLEYLSSDDCISTLATYDQELSAEWKPIKAWYEISNKSVGNVHAVRLYHGLCTDPDANVDGPFLVEDGCAYKISLEYHWNESSVPTVTHSTSGVSYHITNISHDQETDRYSYVIEKRERVQQDVAEYFTAKTVYSDYSEEYHLGVKQDRVESTGKQASVENGKLVKRKITKNSDCTSDVHNTIEQEKPVPGAAESVHVGLTGTTVSVTNRNMPEKYPTDNLEIGQTVENIKTEGGRWNQTIRTLVRNARNWIRGVCAKTVFAHTHSETNVQSEDPGFDHVEEAAEGVIHRKTVSRTADGAYEVDDQVTEEKAVQGASETVRKGLEGTTKVTVNRNMPEKAATDDLDIGDSVENTETEGGRWNQTIRQSIRTAFTHIADSCRKTIFAHRHGKVDVRGEDPGFTHVEEAGGGVIKEKSVQRTADGAYRVSEDETIEKPVSQSSRSVRMTLHGAEVREESRNQPLPLPERGLRVGEGVQNSKTDGGLWNTVKTMSGVTPAGRISDSCAQDNFTHDHSTVTNKAEMEPTEHVFEVGRIVHKSSSMNSNGTADVSERTTIAKPTTNRYSFQKDNGIRVHVVEYHNHSDEYRNYPLRAAGLSVSDSVNRFGLHDGHVTWMTGVPYFWNNADYKFIKHGQQIMFYFSTWNTYWRRWMHKRMTVQMHWIRGDAYTDYVHDQLSANPDRDTNGVLWTQLVSGPYQDSSGAVLAEWKWIEVTARDADWVFCTKGCHHDHETNLSDIKEKMRELLGRENPQAISKESENRQQNVSLVEAIRSIPSELANILSGVNRGDSAGGGSDSDAKVIHWGR